MLPWTLKKAKCKLLGEVISSVPWESALVAGSGVYESWSLFKNHSLKAQKQVILLYHKSSKQGRKTVYLNWEFLLELRQQKNIKYLWKQDLFFQGEYRAAVCTCRCNQEKPMLNLN